MAKTTMSIYIDEEDARRFRALCALQGISPGKKIKEVVDNEAGDVGLVSVPSPDQTAVEV